MAGRKSTFPVFLILAISSIGCAELLVTCLTPFDVEEFHASVIHDFGWSGVVVISWKTSFSGAEIGGCDVYARPVGEEEFEIGYGGVNSAIMTVIEKTTTFRLNCWQGCGADIGAESTLVYEPSE